MTDLEKKIATKLGVLTAKDFDDVKKFGDRILKISAYSSERNCQLYVDAEQTFIQAGIESFGQQMTHKLNQADKVIIMNGYQCYLKRMAHTIPMEVKASQVFGFNLGIKLIRGAYMMEERSLAEKEGVESPVWDDIEATHKCYNDSMDHIITHMDNQDMLFVASHNNTTCDKAIELIEEYGFRENARVRFGQLRGFSDQVTGGLAEKRFKVFKYLPFGPTEQVMPYLVRRGQESRQVLRE